MAVPLRVKTLTVVSGREMKCICCGTCCKSYSKVDLTITDVFNISAHLGIGTDDFFAGYCKTMSNGDDGTTFQMDIEGGCRFQRDGKCTIYPVRPDMCAMYPFNLMSLYASRALKSDLRRFEKCYVHSLPDDLVIVPDLERMVDSRIMFMVMEMYLARYGGNFREEDALEYHRKGLAQVKNERMRNIMHMQLLNEFLKDPPRDVDTKERILSDEEIRQIYNYARGLLRA